MLGCLMRLGSRVLHGHHLDSVVSTRVVQRCSEAASKIQSPDGLGMNFGTLFIGVSSAISGTGTLCLSCCTNRPKKRSSSHAPPQVPPPPTSRHLSVTSWMKGLPHWKMLQLTLARSRLLVRPSQAAGLKRVSHETRFFRARVRLRVLHRPARSAPLLLAIELGQLAWQCRWRFFNVSWTPLGGHQECRNA